MPIGADAQAKVAIVGQNLTGLAFRGAVNDANTAAKRMAGAFKFAFAGFAALGVGTAFRSIFKQMDEAQKATAQLNAALKSTGGIVGLSKNELEGFATTLQRTTTFSDDAVKAMQAVLLSFTNLRGPQFLAANKAIVDLATRLGTDLPTAARTVGKALNDPANAFGVLRKAGIAFSNAEEDVIKKLVETGDVAAAQDKILEALTQRFGGAAEAARNTLGGAITGLTNAFGELFEGTEAGSKQATDAINQFADALNDPRLKRAIDSVIGGAASTFSVLGRAAAASAGAVETSFAFITQQYERLPAAVREILDKGGEFGLRGLPVFGALSALAGPEEEQRPRSQFARGERAARDAGFSADLFADLDELEVSVRKITTLKDPVDDFLKQLEESTRTSVEKQAIAWETYVLDVRTSLATGEIDAAEAAKRIAERFDEELPEIVVGAHKISADLKNVFDGMTVYADQAARNIQDSFADFLFDPFEDGLRGMLKGFIDVIRRMLAEMAAAKLFDSKAAGGFGLGGFLSGLFSGFGGAAGAGAGGGAGRVPGFAAGGSFMVGGRSGVDQNLVAFGATRGERVTVTPAGGGGAHGDVVINTNIDARGATTDFIKALPEVLRRNNEQLESRIVTRLKRGQYDLQR